MSGTEGTFQNLWTSYDGKVAGDPDIPVVRTSLSQATAIPKAARPCQRFITETSS
jgi:hypothetical protein